ncbi:hypothetical protein PUN28_017144 [Cardiocondyla obscurior]|uniref:Uncharacterized protein n=1 Tax=Cardiocondyla obscurior TaxID=286306 RepID=A0AAW2EMS8_9HYME
MRSMNVGWGLRVPIRLIQRYDGRQPRSPSPPAKCLESTASSQACPVVSREFKRASYSPPAPGSCNNGS